MTRIAVDLPEDIAKRLESAWHDVSRGTLEAVALEAYRDGTLSRARVGRVLGLSFWETEPFLKGRDRRRKSTPRSRISILVSERRSHWRGPSGPIADRRRRA